MTKKIEPAMITEMPTHGGHSNPKIVLADVEVSRAGSDYLGMVWSISVVGVSFDIGTTYSFVVRDKGELYKATAIRTERLDGKLTTLFVEPEYANMFM